MRFEFAILSLFHCRGADIDITIEIYVMTWFAICVEFTCCKQMLDQWQHSQADAFGAPIGSEKMLRIMNAAHMVNDPGKVIFILQSFEISRKDFGVFYILGSLRYEIWCRVRHRDHVSG